MEFDEPSIDDVIKDVEIFMKAFKVEEFDIRILLTPGRGREKDMPAFQYFVKAYSEREPSMDGSIYVEEGMMGERYEDWVELFEDTFSEAYVASADDEMLNTMLEMN